jgi:hypothetical protein
MAFAFTLDKQIRRWMLALPVPRVQHLRLQPGTTPLGIALENKFAWSDKLLKHLLNLPAGLLAGIALLLIGLLLYRRFGDYPRQLLSVWLAGSILLSALPIVEILRGDASCGDVIAANQTVGAYLNEVIPAGSQIYWDGGSAVVPLLYVPHATLYLPQINSTYSFHIGGDADALLKFGRWNAVLAERWKAEADFILVEDARYNESWNEILNAGVYDEITASAQTDPCRKSSGIHIFRRLQ